MNLEEIENLSGQELTNAVAIHVMKWTHEELDNGYNQGYMAPYWVKCDISEKTSAELHDNHHRYIYPSNFWHPHKDLNQMNEVIIMMRENGYGTFKTWSYDFCEGFASSFTCHYGICERHGNKEYDAHGSEDIEGDTMQESVLRAALAATLIV